jgi:hypothetical protein
MKYPRAKVKALVAAALAAALLVGGCELHQATPVPITVKQYDEMKAASPQAYPPRTVALHNLQRVLDPQLPEPQRVESLRLVTQLGQDDPDIRGQLAGLLSDPASSDALRQAALEVLLRGDQPGLAAYVVTILPKLDPASPLKKQVLEWMTRHPSPAVLGELVKLWAQEKSVTSPEEPRYRQVVEALSGKKWEQAVLDELNSDAFRSRGSALEVLAARMTPQKLRQSILALRPQTDAVIAMQVFISRFDYLPTNRDALLGCVWLNKTKRPLVDDAARQAADWQQDYGYGFAIWDFHLLSRLARDPLRRNFRRTHLILELAQSLLKRPHAPRAIPRAVGPYDFSDRFSKHVDILSMADLWRLMLLNEMLSRPRVQAALRIMAEGDRNDTRSAWGGLIFYESGQAEAKLYPPSYAPGASDMLYVPTEEAVRDGRDSLCRFHGHFEVLDNAARSGPSTEELQDARQGAYAGLILTSLSKDAFCAHYYNPQGIVISLGRFPFR